MTNRAELIEIEAATFRALVAHLDENRQVQNIDMMILANFCRNCLSKWYAAAAEERNTEMEYEQAREVIYGMPYDDWKNAHQLPATANQLELLKQRQKLNNIE
ncbi:DUF1244 domain-containing protein [Porticoccaceae bacterium]|nr:DUF1244 domain-containing protein [Porticoccaceae bacterium]